MKFSINRKNRDRRGGHKPTLLVGADGICGYTQSERAFIKREGRRELRRQHKKATQEAMSEFYQELNDYASVYGLDWDDRDYYVEIQNYEDYCNHKLDEEYYSSSRYHDMGRDDDYYDTYFDDDPFSYWGHDDPQETYGRNRIITENDLGMTLGELIEKYIN